MAIGCELHKLSEWEKDVEQIVKKHGANLEKAKNAVEIAKILTKWTN